MTSDWVGSPCGPQRLFLDMPNCTRVGMVRYLIWKTVDQSLFSPPAWGWSDDARAKVQTPRFSPQVWGWSDPTMPAHRYLIVLPTVWGWSAVEHDVIESPTILPTDVGMVRYG